MQINTAPGPKWLTLVAPKGKAKATRILLSPITKALSRKAIRAGAKAFPDLVIDDDTDIDELVDYSDFVGREMVRLGASDWEGLTDLAGKSLAFSAEALDAALIDEESGFYDLIEREWLSPWRTRQAEKNGFGALPRGIGKAGTQAKTIAKSPAPSAKAGSAAKSASIPSTRSRPKKAKASGTS